MHVVALATAPRLRWLAVSALAASGALAWRIAHRSPAPPPDQLITCTIPSIDPTPVPQPPPPDHFAVPPPGDPYPRPEQLGPRTLVADLVWRDPATPGCGAYEVKDYVTFRPVDGGGDLSVLVECPDLLALSARYSITVVAQPTDDRSGVVRWTATRVERLRGPTPAQPIKRIVEGELVDEPDRLPDCGRVLFETTMTFRPLKAVGFGDLRVLVPCAEMTRAQFGGPDAGNAGVLVRGHRYMLWLDEATDVADGKNDTLWRAVRIDERGYYPVTVTARR